MLDKPLLAGVSAAVSASAAEGWSISVLNCSKLATAAVTSAVDTEVQPCVCERLTTAEVRLGQQLTYDTIVGFSAYGGVARKSDVSSIYAARACNASLQLPALL